MPAIYRPPSGGPLRWQDDVTGVLPDAVKAFVAYGAKQQPSITDQRVELVRDYCQYYINAPCWETATMERGFAGLRKRITAIQTCAELDARLHDCLDVGIDPL